MSLQEQSTQTPAATVKRVLVVEDDELLRDLVCRSLTRYGFQTVQAANGEEAFRIFSEALSAPTESLRLHAAVTDYLMPKSDGADLVGKIKAVCPEFPVVLVTGEAPDAVILRVAALPEVIALLKPFRPEALREALRSVLHEPLAEGKKEYRRCTRVDCAVTCTFYETADPSNQPHFASVRNLGFGGCYVQTEKKLAIGTKVRFFFQGLDRYVFVGRVVWTGNSGVGLALIPECPEAISFFQKFVLNKLKQKGVGIMGANCASEEAAHV